MSDTDGIAGSNDATPAPPPTFSSSTPTAEAQATSPPGTRDTTLGVAGTPHSHSQVAAGTPPHSPAGTVATGAEGYTPMRQGKVHALDDSPGNRKAEAERWARAQADMERRGRAVDNMRAARAKAPASPKQVAGGDAARACGIPVWTGRALSEVGNDPPQRQVPDPFERGRVLYAQIQAAEAEQKKRAAAKLPASGLRPLPMAPRLSTVAKGKQRALPGRRSPPPTAGPSAYTSNAVLRSAQSEPWRPLTQYLPHQREPESSGDERNFPRMERRPAIPISHPEPAGRSRARRESAARPVSPLERKSDEADARRDAAELERRNEAIARRIQEELWAEEHAYNRSRRSQARSSTDDPMDEDDFFDDGEEDILAPDSDAEADGFDSFDEMSDVESPAGSDAGPALINIEPALGDDRAKAAARAAIFTDTKARIRWSKITCEPIAGMTKAKLVAGIDPAQLRQHENEASRPDNIYIGIVHAVGGTRSADMDRVTLVTALDTMIKLTCRSGTQVLFSAARQDANGPRLRPGTVLIHTSDDELKKLWQENAHWAQAGIRLTIQKYHQPHSAFMVTLEGTHRNRHAVAHGVRAAARELPQLKAIFRQYSALHPGKGRAARNSLIRSITARPLALTSKRALGFGSVQYNIYAHLKERDPEAQLLTGDDEVDGYPPLSAAMHSEIRDAFQEIGIIDGKLGDATPIKEQWDCDHCLAESHPVGKCDLKDIEGWFKTYEEFVLANAPAVQDKKKGGGADKKGRTKQQAQRGGRGGGPTRGGPPRAGPSRGGPARRNGGR